MRHLIIETENTMLKTLIILLSFLVTTSCNSSIQSEDAFFECVEQKLNDMDDYSYNEFLSSMNAIKTIILDFEKSSNINNKVALSFIESLNNTEHSKDLLLKIEQLSSEEYTDHKVNSYYHIKSCIIEVAELHSLSNSRLLKSQLQLHNTMDNNSTVETKDLRKFINSNDLTQRNDQTLFYYWVYMYSTIKQIEKE